MRPRLLLPLLLTGLAGCVYGPPPAASAGPYFDVRQARYVLRHGTNTVLGRAEVDDSQNGYASCAGDEASLIPDTPYTRYRLDRLYGGAHRRSADIRDAPHLPRDPHYQSYIRHAPCGPSGVFEFDQVADGHYVVVAGLHSAREGLGGGLSVRRTVAVYGGTTRSLVLTP